MATASTHGLGISTIGPECARREFFLVQFVMWAVLIPLLLLIVTNLHTTHTSEISAFISHIDYGALIAGVVMMAGGYAGSQLKEVDQKATFAAYLVSILAYAFICTTSKIRIFATLSDQSSFAAGLAFT
jgi:bacteriorhodopsin